MEESWTEDHSSRMGDHYFKKADFNVEEAMLMKECYVEDEMEDGCLVKSNLHIGE